MEELLLASKEKQRTSSDAKIASTQKIFSLAVESYKNILANTRLKNLLINLIQDDLP